MSATGLSTFDETVQLSNKWLNELMRAVDWDDKYRGLPAPPGNSSRASRLSRNPGSGSTWGTAANAHPRALLRWWSETEVPTSERTKEQSLRHIDAAFETDPTADTEALVKEVFKLMDRRISGGEIDDVKVTLPSEVRSLWPSTATERKAI